MEIKKAVPYGIGALRIVVIGLSEHQKDVTRKAEQDYKKFGKQFEKEVFKELEPLIERSEELLEASFWLDGDELHIDTGY